jgi:hypothetical protein
MKVAEAKTPATAAKSNAPFFQKGAAQSLLTAEEAPQPFFQKKQRDPVGIQAKLSIGQPNDKYEQEADAMADKVVQRLSTPAADPSKSKPSGDIQAKPLAAAITPLVQRKCSTCEHEEKLQKKEDDPEAVKGELQKSPIFGSNAEPPPDEDKPVQRKCEACGHEKEVQMKPDSMASQAASPSVEASLSASKGSGSPMPAAALTQMEGSFGTDFSGVRIHTGSTAVQMSKDLNAQAFTHGSDIYFNAGKYDPESQQGRHLLAHELTHTVQQGASVKRKIIQRQDNDGGNSPAPAAEGSSADATLPAGGQGDSTHEEDSIPDGTPVPEHHPSDCPQLVPPYPTGEGESAPGADSSVYDVLISIGSSSGLLGIFTPLISNGARYLWMILPMSIKVRIINEALDIAISGARLQQVIGRNISGTGAFMLTLLSSFLIGFYRTIRNLPDPQKVAMFERHMRIIMGGDMTFTLHYVKGIIMGFFLDGLVGIIQMVVDVLCFIPRIVNFFSAIPDFIRQIPGELGALIKAIDTFMGGLGKMMRNGVQELYELIKSPSRIGLFFDSISNAINLAAENVGARAAGAMVRFSNLPSAALGEISGRIAGQIMFEAVLIYFTAGGGAALTAGKTALRYVGRLLGNLGKFIFKIVGYIGRVLNYVKEALAGAARFLTNMFRLLARQAGVVIDKLLEIFSAFRRLCRPGSIICHVPNGLLNVLRRTRNGFYMIQGDLATGWTHIQARHMLGGARVTSGTSMFPRGMSAGVARNLIIEAVENGAVVRSQAGGRSLIRYSPNRLGVSQIEVWVNSATRVIETGYPTSGAAVWLAP